MSRDPDQVRALAREGQQVVVPSDVIKDPFVLELLDLCETLTAQERDLQRAIIGRLALRSVSARRPRGEEELRAELAREREEAERVLRLASETPATS